MAATGASKPYWLSWRNAWKSCGEYSPHGLSIAGFVLGTGWCWPYERMRWSSARWQDDLAVILRGLQYRCGWSISPAGQPPFPSCNSTSAQSACSPGIIWEKINSAKRRYQRWDRCLMETQLPISTLCIMPVDLLFSVIKGLSSCSFQWSPQITS